MSSMFQVQDNVPLPEINRAPRSPRRKYPVEGMTPGQMFFVPGKSSRSVSAYISRITKNLPGKYNARHCWMWQDQRDGKWHLCDPSAAGAKEGVGVWRTD